MSGEVNMIPTLKNLEGGAIPSKFWGGQSRDIFRGGPVKKITLYIQDTNDNRIIWSTMRPQNEFDDKCLKLNICLLEGFYIRQQKNPNYKLSTAYTILGEI